MSSNPYELLKGVRILELTTYVAAPSGGRLLADWGAEIIKVEATPRGDVTRFVVPLPGMKPVAYQLHNANRQKKVRKSCINCWQQPMFCLQTQEQQR